jgi:hypothetical protein
MGAQILNTPYLATPHHLAPTHIAQPHPYPPYTINLSLENLRALCDPAGEQGFHNATSEGQGDAHLQRSGWEQSGAGTYCRCVGV